MKSLIQMSKVRLTDKKLDQHVKSQIKSEINTSKVKATEKKLEQQIKSQIKVRCKGKRILGSSNYRFSDPILLFRLGKPSKKKTWAPLSGSIY